jgi:hypothetical protein
MLDPSSYSDWIAVWDPAAAAAMDEWISVVVVVAAATELMGHHSRYNYFLVIDIDTCKMAGRRRPPRPMDRHGRGPWFLFFFFF